MNFTYASALTHCTFEHTLQYVGCLWEAYLFHLHFIFIIFINNIDIVFLEYAAVPFQSRREDVEQVMAGY